LKISLPVDSNPRTYPLETCDLMTAVSPIGLSSSEYLGLMVYVPKGFSIANASSSGVNIYEMHFQNIYGSPVTLQMHTNNVVLSLETGGCAAHTTSQPGCQYRSNAGHSPCKFSGVHCLPGYYAVPPGAFVQGAWNEIVLHVLWTNTTAGQIQSYYRVKGSSSWTQSSNITGIPTVQWNNAKGCCASGYNDELEAYTAALRSPMSVWFDNVVDGTSLSAVESAMP